MSPCDQDNDLFLWARSQEPIWPKFSFDIHFCTKRYLLSLESKKKTCPRCFREGLTQTGLYSHRRGLNFEFRKESDCTIYLVKTKALISCMTWAFVFAYAQSRFSHDAAQRDNVVES